MPQPKVTADEVRGGLRRARRELAERKFSPGGDIYRNFAEPFDAIERYVEQQEAEDGIVLNPVVLRESALIWRTVEDQLSADMIKAEAVGVRILKPKPTDAADKPRSYRVTLKTLGAFEGTAEQAVDLVKVAGSILAQREAERLAAERKAQREAEREKPPQVAEAEVLPMADPASRG